jgi:hypothetical protein
LGQPSGMNWIGWQLERGKVPEEKVIQEILAIQKLVIDLNLHPCEPLKFSEFSEIVKSFCRHIFDIKQYFSESDYIIFNPQKFLRKSDREKRVVNRLCDRLASRSIYGHPSSRLRSRCHSRPRRTLNTLAVGTCRRIQRRPPPSHNTLPPAILSRLIATNVTKSQTRPLVI